MSANRLRRQSGVADQRWRGEDQIAVFCGQSDDLHPVGRIGEGLDIAQAALFLASDDSSFTIGRPIVADGAWTSVNAHTERLRAFRYPPTNRPATIERSHRRANPKADHGRPRPARRNA